MSQNASSSLRPPYPISSRFIIRRRVSVAGVDVPLRAQSKVSHSVTPDERCRSAQPTIRFETAPGPQAHVDFADFNLPWAKR